MKIKLKKKEQQDQVGLKRELGLFSAVSMIVAVMIGTNFSYFFDINTFSIRLT